jgi:leader peptidase (prepilin peptidase)/N-methyltransferase
LGPLLLGANLAIAVLLGIIGGVLGIILAKKLESPSSSESSENADASVMTPTPIGFIVLSGAWYLFCLDIVSLAVPALNRWISTKIPQEIVEEEENWKPSLTTIPFGPYLAAGAIICMIGGGPIEGAIRNYWEHATGSASDSSATSPAQTRS